MPSSSPIEGEPVESWTEEFARLEARKGDCGVCGVSARHWVEVCEGYAVPRCDDHVESPAYQAEARLDTLLSTQPNPIGDREQLQELLEAVDEHRSKREQHPKGPSKRNEKLWATADRIRADQKAGSTDG
jgi:hypothetical protein